MNDKVRIFENKMLGGFEVEYDGIAVAQFFYYTEWDERGFMTRDAAKKLATKIAPQLRRARLSKPKKDSNYLNGKGTTMTNDKYLLETFLMEYPRAGIIAVIHRNYRIAMFPYHRNEDEKGLPTRDFALEMAIELRDKIKKCTTEESDTGITFVEKEQPIFND